MTFKSFLKLVEIQTKVASIIPFLLGTLYALFRYNTFSVNNFLLMLFSLLCVDMGTTTVNNYQDYKRANKREGYGYESHNAIVRDNIKESTVLIVISILFTIAIILGILLYLNTNIILLIIGGVSVVTGILYSYGPLPISRTPFGEIFSGGFMGFVIPFLATYIHIYDHHIITMEISNRLLALEINYIELIFILLFSAPAIMGIANIMLANNICDLEDDIENKRYTLPFYIGKKNALKLFEWLYYTGYFALVILLVLRVIPVISAVTIITIIPVKKHINIFMKEQSKKDTFVLAVKNFVLINVVLVLSLTVALLWNISK